MEPFPNRDPGRILIYEKAVDLRLPPTEVEINITEAPVELQTAVKRHEDRGCEVLSVRLIKNYPYNDPQKENIKFKAYMIWGNLMILLTKYDWKEEIEEDAMTSSDVKKMFGFWNDRFNGCSLVENEW